MASTKYFFAAELASLKQSSLQKCFVLAIVLSAVFAPAVAQAGQTAVDKAGFSVHLEDETVATEVLSVTNFDATTLRYTLAIAEGDRALLDYVSFSPKSFSVLPGETETVAVRFRRPEKTLTGVLELVSFDATKRADLKVGSGIKLPVVLDAGTVLGASTQARRFGGRWWAVGAVYAADTLLVTALFFVFRRRFLRSRRGSIRISFV